LPLLLHSELSPAQRVPALITLVVTFCLGAGVLLAHAERQPAVMANATPDGAPAMLILGVL